MKPLRVLMVSDVYFPRVNGVSTSIETFRESLADNGVEVRLVAPRYADEPDVPGIVRVPGRKVPRDPEDRIAGWRGMHRAALAGAADCALVHIQTPFVAHYAGVAVARQHGLPRVLTYHTLFEEYLHHYAPFLPGAMLRGLARKLSRAQCNAVDAVVVPSSAMRERLEGYGVHRPMHVLPTGIPLSAFGNGDRRRFRAARGIPDATPLALFVGRVAHEKNIDFLLDVMIHARQHMPELILMIAGEGPAMPALQARAFRLGIDANIRFVGYLERSEALQDCYAAADAFVFASRTETQGLVLLEAMATGLPVVALAEMGTRDIVAPERGARIAPDDSGGFASVLLSVLADLDVRQHMSAEALVFSQAWRAEVLAGRLAALYRALAEAAERGKAPASL
ncbi:MAG: glycosyltransferase [Rhodocyclaceae bacterium]